MAVPLWFLQEERRSVTRTRRQLDNLSDYEIRKNFGFPWWGAKSIVDYYEPLEGTRSSSIPLETKVLTFLSYLRSGSFQWSLGTLSGVSQSSASRIIESCCNFTISNAKSLINFPQSPEDRLSNKLGFFQLSDSKFGGILGVVDGTHVNIRAPWKDEHIYVNRKNHHSINCQVVCNSEYYILDLVAKWPGSTHDAFIWKNSSVRDRLKSGKLGDGYFLGDSGYPLEPWLLTPYMSTSSANQVNFNIALKKTRSVVERAIGNWKCRFRSMCLTGGFSCYSEGKVCRLIASSIALHNICITKEIPVVEEDEHFRDLIVLPQEQEQQEYSAAQTLNQAKITRDNIANSLSY